MKTNSRESPTSVRTVGSLFCGMGGFASGLTRSGFRINWASDVDEVACETFRHRFPDTQLIEKDVRELSVSDDQLSDVDVLVGGFPCQSFSIAGNRRGFDDPRGRLFFEILRIIDEYPSEKRPALIVLENVPNILYGNNGEWFDRIRRSIRRAGYWFRSESCVIANVKDSTPLPQDRERFFMFAALKSRYSRNPFPTNSLLNQSTQETRRLSEFINLDVKSDEYAYLPRENRYYKMIRRAIGNGESASNIYQIRRSYVREKRDGLCPTLTANMGSGGHNIPFVRDSWGIRRLSVDEVAQLQGFADTVNLFPDIPEKDRYRLLGNAVCVELAYLVGNICMQVLEDTFLSYE